MASFKSVLKEKVFKCKDEATYEKVRSLIRLADKNRDMRNWKEAEDAYKLIVFLDPQRSACWIQLGHVVKEQQRYSEAEAYYRTACALGCKPQQVEEHLNFTMKEQGIDPGHYPPHYGRLTSPTYASPPTLPILKILAKLLWQEDNISFEEALPLLREYSNCDSALAAMVNSQKFISANLSFLGTLREEQLSNA